MTNERYNGWSNYETWAIHLWLSNEEETYRDVVAVVAAAPDIYAAAELISAMIEDSNPLESASLYSDLLTHSLGRVNWKELAEAFVVDTDTAA